MRGQQPGAHDGLVDALDEPLDGERRATERKLAQRGDRGHVNVVGGALWKLAEEALRVAVHMRHKPVALVRVGFERAGRRLQFENPGPLPT